MKCGVLDNQGPHPLEIFQKLGVFMGQRSALIVIVIVLLFAGCGYTDDQPYDLLITGGLVIDGTGAPGMSVDVAITADSIVSVGQLDDARAKTVIDAAGLTVTPGFIDIHTHSDYALLADGNAESKIRQGVTTEILGESASAGPRRTEWDDGEYGITPDWETLGGYFDRVLTSGILSQYWLIRGFNADSPLCDGR